MTTIYTMGFTKKAAPAFFGALREAGIRRLIDIRLNNTSQLAGFTRRADLPFLLEAVLGAEYRHEPLLAPTQDILDRFKKQRGTWQEYERDFLRLIADRRIEDRLDRALFAVPSVLLCSEPTPERCHRRLAAEYLAERWGDLSIVHL